jgi:hypothetical protein
MMLGGIDKKMYWKEYVAGFKDEYDRKCLEAVKRYIEVNHLEGMCGFEYQDSKHCSKIDDLSGKNIRGFSFRAWGDFMAALMNSKLGKRRYDYCSFAW